MFKKYLYAAAVAVYSLSSAHATDLIDSDSSECAIFLSLATVPPAECLPERTRAFIVNFDNVENLEAADHSLRNNAEIEAIMETASREQEELSQTAELSHAPEVVSDAGTSIATPLDSIVDGPSVAMNVLFGFNSNDLTPDAMKLLDKVAAVVKSEISHGRSFNIIGHTDSVGNPDYNLNLSQRRATAVLKYLAYRHDIPAQHLQSSGMGEWQPLNPEFPEAAENRRVELINTSR